MARAFDITAASDSVRLDTQGQGDAGFTVSNVSGRRLRGRARIAPKDPAAAGWLSIAGDVERDFPAGGTQLYTVTVAVPADARAGTHAFRIDVVSVDNPDEETAQGPSVAFTVAEAAPPPPKSYALWLVLAVVLVLIAAGAAIWLVLRSPAPPPPPVAAAKFAGEWSTNFAALTLEQDGAKVTGSYRLYGNGPEVPVEGTIKDRTLAGSIADPAGKAAFSLTLDSGDQSFTGTRDGNTSWCGVRGQRSSLPAGCGFTGVWTFRHGSQTMTLELEQEEDGVSGPIKAEVAGRRLQGSLRGHLRGWVLEGTLQAEQLDKHIRWTLLDRDFQQFQGIEFPFVVRGDPRVVVYLEDNCGARDGTPLPSPCREPTGTISDRSTFNARQVNQWDSLDDASLQPVEIVGGDFRATVTVKAPTTRHGDLVGFGVKESAGTGRWAAVIKFFAADSRPDEQPMPMTGVLAKVAPESAVEMLTPIVYTNDVVHFMIDRQGDRFTLSFSPDGREWKPVQENLQLPIGSHASVFVFAYSTTENAPFAADLSDWQVRAR